MTRIVLVDDASRDGTGDLLQRWAAKQPNALALRLREPLGKAQALNHGIAAVPEAELLAVSDADQEPRPDCFRRIAEVFADPSVGAVAGYLVPANAGVTPIAHYAAVEAWVHQLVTSAGKDRLDLAAQETLLQALRALAGYRGEALGRVGGSRHQPPSSAGANHNHSHTLPVRSTRTITAAIIASPNAAIASV